MRETIAQLARFLANVVVPWRKIKALFACRLIALDKQPGVRPIGIGETLRRLIGKAITNVTGEDLCDTFGVEQLAGGIEGGIEGSIHALRTLYEEKKNEGFGLLMLDAANAFNSINRKAALINAKTEWPRASTFLYNSYQCPAELVIKNTEKRIFSREGTTQGDPMSMLFYGMALMPLIRKLRNTKKYVQSFNADDASCCGTFENMKVWLDEIIAIGPKYGYYPEPSKSYIVVEEKFVGKYGCKFVGLDETKKRIQR